MRALLAARRPAVLAGMQSALMGFDDAAEFVSTGTVQSVWALLRTDRAFDLVLLGVDDRDLSELGQVAEARGEFPDVPVVVVSPGQEAAVLPALAVAAAAGGAKPAEVPREGREGREGREVRDDREATDGRENWGFVPTAHAAMLSLGLTTRQAEVLALLLEGASNKVIARSLGLAVDTVKDHVAAVMRNLGVNSRTQAVLVVTERLSRSSGPGSPTPRLPRVRVGSPGNRDR